MPAQPHPWPYPKLIAHRGAGKHAPENTLAAMRFGAHHGFLMFEYDVKLSRDGMAILLHDDTLERTSNGHGRAADYSYAELCQLDFGAWHSPEYVGEPIPSLYTIANFSLARGLHSNIEIKPSQGLEAETGAQIARLTQKLWHQAALPPLLSSFSVAALQAAALSAPELPRALLIEQPQQTAEILQQMQRLGCKGLNIDFQLITEELIQGCHQAGFFITAWTVNERAQVEHLFARGVDAIFTDAVTEGLI